MLPSFALALVLTVFTPVGGAAAGIGGYLMVWGLCGAAFVIAAIVLAWTLEAAQQLTDTW